MKAQTKPVEVAAGTELAGRTGVRLDAKHLLGLEDLSREELLHIFRTAETSRGFRRGDQEGAAASGRVVSTCLSRTRPGPRPASPSPPSGSRPT